MGPLALAVWKQKQYNKVTSRKGESMLNWKKTVASVLLLCVVPGCLCAHEQSRRAEEKLFKRVSNYLQQDNIKGLEQYWKSLPQCPWMAKKKDLPEICIGPEAYVMLESDTRPGEVAERNYPLNNVADPYRVLSKALTAQYRQLFGEEPFYFNTHALKKFYGKYKGTFLKSAVESVMMSGDYGGWLELYFSPQNPAEKEKMWGKGIYARAYLNKHLGISTYGMVPEHDKRYPNLVYFDINAAALQRILDGVWAMAHKTGDTGLFHKVKQNIFFNYLNYDTYEREGLLKEFVHTMQLLGATKDDAWRAVEITPITKKLKENAVKLYSKCHGTVGLNKTLCENFQKHAKQHNVWMKINVPPLPTPDRRSTSIL